MTREDYELVKLIRAFDEEERRGISHDERYRIKMDRYRLVLEVK